MKGFIYKELVAASSRPMVLAILAAGDQYGYEIIKQVKRLSEGDRRSRRNWRADGAFS